MGQRSADKQGCCGAPIILQRAGELAEPVLRQQLAGLHPTLTVIAGYHMGWCDVDGKPTAARAGKGVCLALAVLAAEAVGASEEVALAGAAAVELVHVFTHMHDDIMDGDEQRRGRVSAWKAFGVGPTLLAGDAVLTAALRGLVEVGGQPGTRAIAEVLEMCEQLGFGQAQDLEFEQRPLLGPDAVDVAGYLAMAAAKTGALYAGASAVGAILAEASGQTVAALASAGRHLGLLAQIVDDVNGIWGDVKLTGKSIFSDLANRKKTLPVIAAVSSDRAVSRRLVELLSQPAGPEDDLEKLAALIAEAGGLDAAIAEAERHYCYVLDDLSRVVMPPGVRRELGELIEFIRHRRG
jgi:geranylgeranyl diphosphate synthase, type I